MTVEFYSSYPGPEIALNGAIPDSVALSLCERIAGLQRDGTDFYALDSELGKISIERELPGHFSISGLVKAELARYIWRFLSTQGLKCIYLKADENESWRKQWHEQQRKEIAEQEKTRKAEEKRRMLEIEREQLNYEAWLAELQRIEQEWDDQLAREDLSRPLESEPYWYYDEYGQKRYD
jgi:hypothetical protein